jgi:deoxyadenosine/deoxycytidine kinase
MGTISTDQMDILEDVTLASLPTRAMNHFKVSFALVAPVEICHKRIQERGRPEEIVITPEYLTRLDVAFRAWQQQSCTPLHICHLHEIDGTLASEKIAQIIHTQMSEYQNVQTCGMCPDLWHEFDLPS